MGIKNTLLNLEDTISELDALPCGSVVNWAELGGPVEEDSWFVDEQGNGSLVQTILDLSAQRGIVAFFLTKGVYEPYLRLDGRLALLAISLNAPARSRNWRSVSNCLVCCSMEHLSKELHVMKNYHGRVMLSAAKHLRPPTRRCSLPEMLSAAKHDMP